MGDLELSKTSVPFVASGVDLRSVPLGAAAGFLLSRIDGSTDVGGICAISGLPETEASRILRELAAAGLIEFRDKQKPGNGLRASQPPPAAPPKEPPKPAPSPPPGTTDLKVLARTFADAGEKQLYESKFPSALSSFRMALRYDPDNKDYRRKVEMLEPKVASLVSPSKFEKALELLGQGDPAGAIALLREVVVADKRNAKAHYELAKALFSGTKPKGEGGLHKEVLELAERAAILDPRRPEYQSLAGRVNQVVGDADRSRVFFKAALQLNPKDEVARKALALLGTPNENKWVG